MHAIVRNLQSLLARTIHDWLVRSSRPAGLFSFALLDGLSVRLRRPYLREAPAGFGLERLATAFMINPGSSIRLSLPHRFPPAGCWKSRSQEP